MRIRWLLLAVEDLEQLHAYVADDDPDAADREVRGVVAEVGRLERFPGLGRPGRVPGTRELVVSSHIVAYRVRRDEVQVLRVLHSARQWPRTI